MNDLFRQPSHYAITCALYVKKIHGFWVEVCVPAAEQGRRIHLIALTEFERAPKLGELCLLRIKQAYGEQIGAKPLIPLRVFSFPPVLRPTT